MAIVDSFLQNADQQPENNFSALPAGRYTVLIKDSSLNATKDGTGEYFKFTLQVQGPQQHAGRLVFWNINIKNKSETAVNIGRAQWRSLLEAVGVPVCQDTVQLHNILFDVVLKVRPASDAYDESNEVKSVHKIGEGVTQAAPSAAPPPPPPPPPTQATISSPPPPPPNTAAAPAPSGTEPWNE